MLLNAIAEKRQETKDAIQKKQSENMAAQQNQNSVSDGISAQHYRLSGIAFGDAGVYYNFGKSAQLQALAYTQGGQVYVEQGQEKHLGHELGRVVQQKENAVSPTQRLNGVWINDAPVFEDAEDLLSCATSDKSRSQLSSVLGKGPIQRLDDRGTFSGDSGKGFKRPNFQEVLPPPNKGVGSTAPDQAYHHIIPFNRLAGFWGRMVDNRDWVALGRVMRAVVEMYFSQINTPMIQGRDRKAAKDPETTFANPSGEGPGLTREALLAAIAEVETKGITEVSQSQALELIAQMYTWMPFNLVRGQRQRPLDPGEEMDGAAAAAAGEARAAISEIESSSSDSTSQLTAADFIAQYNTLSMLMEAYQKTGDDELSIKRRKNIVEMIVFILKTNALTPVAVSDNLEQRDLDFLTQKVQEATKTLGQRYNKHILPKIDATALTTLKDSGSKPPKDEEKESWFETQKRVLINAQIALLQISMRLAFPTRSIPTSQQLVDAAFGKSQYIVEQSSGAGNNCFFDSLLKLGFTGAGNTAALMRGNMDLLRVATPQPGYTTTGMITTDDIVLFAAHYNIRIQIYTVQGWHLLPAGQAGTGGPLFRIIHTINHYEPLIPSG